LFDTQNIYVSDENYEEKTREQKAEAIRREILLLKAQNKEDEEANLSNVEIQSPVESKVKPLKIPMKPKMVDGVKQRGVPGATLRINQPPGLQTSPQPPEVKSILRSSRSTERNPIQVVNNNNTNSSDNNSGVPTQRRGSFENIGSVKSRIETYLNATEEEVQQQQQQAVVQQPQQQQPSGQHLKSILVNSDKGKKKTPKLVHGGDGLKIYAQSATDYSEDDDEIASRNRKMESHLLQIPELPERPFNLGVRKSKSFASTVGQYECALDEKEASEKKKTMMAFFAADIAAQRASLRKNVEDVPAAKPASVPSAAAAARYVAATTQKRGSITR
jgi:hypothetical protein